VYYLLRCPSCRPRDSELCYCPAMTEKIVRKQQRSNAWEEAGLYWSFSEKAGLYWTEKIGANLVEKAGQ
jgi:hypothetical protein